MYEDAVRYQTKHLDVLQRLGWIEVDGYRRSSHVVVSNSATTIPVENRREGCITS